MTLEQQLADAIILAFDEVGGDMNDAVRNALYHRNPQSWITQETAKVALVGGAELAVTGLHAFTIPLGMAYLMHKMARIVWGIGTLKGAFILENAHYSDLYQVFTLWGNGGYFDASLLDYLPIQQDLFQHALTPNGYEQVRASLSDTRQDAPAKTTRALLHTATTFANDERAQTQYRTILGIQALTTALETASTRAFTAQELPVPTLIERKVGAKLALRLASQLGAKLPARIIMGFVPIAGMIANAFFNAQTLESIAETAITYYDNVYTIDQFKADNPA